jgi:hypothetical protein
VVRVRIMSERLFLQLFNPHDHSIQDREGVEFIDLPQAKAAVAAMVDELRQEAASTGQDWSGWVLNVTDAAGCVRFSIDLANADQ